MNMRFGLILLLLAVNSTFAMEQENFDNTKKRNHEEEDNRDAKKQKADNQDSVETGVDFTEILPQEIIGEILDGHIEISKALIESNADVNGKNEYGFTVLAYAAHLGNTELIKDLIKAGADINAMDMDGGNALHGAAVCGKNEAVKVLIEAGINIDSQSKNGHTALIHAVNNGYIEIVETLIKAGANLNLKYWEDDTALKTAKRNLRYLRKGFKEIIELLESKGAKQFNNPEEL